ncbi:MAG: hypothetical protein K6T76_13240 [Alicyclobacillus mali]|uniref:hypothetical protein n=1 Tax=Alicyclobacillus mali (ex Roth et al. 2021) TaxID=1123961 RepID=UPI0023EFE26F|nr:hypothetical protein [Alicyclobacillus mali (ex Roth et al. 2021)]MCL6489883.1 hypothetical protein [Alicyclobacillus mali (ex Roth et al. 2021)]
MHVQPHDQYSGEFSYRGRQLAWFASHDDETTWSFWPSEFKDGEWVQLPVYWTGQGDINHLVTKIEPEIKRWIDDRENGIPWPPELYPYLR